MYGDVAGKLIQESKRAQVLDRIPLYQQDQVSVIVKEMRELGRAIVISRNNAQRCQQEADNLDRQLDEGKIIKLLQEKQSHMGNLIVHQLCLERNKRCLLGYQNERARQIDTLVWSGQQIATTGNDNDNYNNEEEEPVYDSLSPAEQDYFRGFADTLADYKGEWTDIDLTGSLTPPKDLFIDVRVLKDAGEIQTEYGVLTLSKNSQFYVRHGDVERLIRQGLLQRLS